VAREIGSAPQVLNALDGLARVALARGDAEEARHRADELIAAAGAGPNPFAGAYEHMIRLTVLRASANVDDPRARALLADARARVQAEAGRIRDADLRACFLTRIAEHRDIVALWVSAARR
jgi:hypothetical protein